MFRLENQWIGFSLTRKSFRGDCFRFRIEGGASRVFVSASTSARRMNKNGKKKRGGHQSRNEIEGLVVISVDLAQIREQVRPCCGRKSPGQHHQAENGSHVPRPKIIS